MTQLPKQSISNIGLYGLVRQSEVYDTLLPDGAVTEVQNFHFDSKGVAIVRPGITAIGATVTTTNSYPCVGIHNALSGTLIAVFSGAGSSTIYDFNGGAWVASLTGGTGSIRIRFTDFGSFVISPNFFQNTLSSMVFWAAGADGSSYWKTSGSPINPQNLWGYNPQLVEVYKSRVYASGDTSITSNPSRLLFSAVISSTGNITWSPTTDYVDINPGDGEGITGMKRYSLELLLFKPNYIYRFRTTGVDPDPLIRVGTRSQESIVEGKRGLYFHHDSGFYRYSGGYPEDISRAVSDFVSAIPFSQYDDIIGWKDNDHIYWAIGNVTISETSGQVPWKNVVLRYTESSDVWTIYSYSRDIRRAVQFITGTSSSLVVATDHGVVAQFNNGATDLLEPIKYRVVTRWYDWGGVERIKAISQAVAVTEKALGAHIMCQINDEISWKEWGEVKSFITYLDPLFQKFHRIRFKVTGVTDGEKPMFIGLEITELEDHGITKNG